MEEDKKDWERCLIDYYRLACGKYRSDSTQYQLRYYSQRNNNILFAKRMQQAFTELDIIMTDNGIKNDEMKSIIRSNIKSCIEEIGGVNI